MTTFYAMHDPTTGRVTGIGHMAIDMTDAALATLDAVRIDVDQHNAIRSNPTHWVNQGGLISEAGPEVQALTEVQLWASLRIDAAAETARLAFLTPGAGQAMEYQQTQSDAERANAAAAAGEVLTAADYPWLEAERAAIAASGPGSPTLLDVAQGVVATMAGWTAAGAEIKRVRRSAKIAVGNCTTAAEVAAIVDGLVWPAPT